MARSGGPTNLRTVDYLPGELLRWLHRRRGSILRVPAPPTPVTYLFGPEASRGTYTVVDRRLRATGLAALRPTDGLHILLEPVR